MSQIEIAHYAMREIVQGLGLVEVAWKAQLNVIKGSVISKLPNLFRSKCALSTSLITYAPTYCLTLK